MSVQRSSALARPLTLAMLFMMLVAPGGARGQGVVPSGFADALVVGGLSEPVGIAFLPDGRLLLVEQNSARIRLIVNGALSLVDPVGTVPNVLGGGERGLLGVAVDPAWPTRPYVYVMHSYALTPNSRISRFTLTGDVAFTGTGALVLDPASRFDILTTIPDNADNHNGGTLRFGSDGMLYASMGDDGAACAAQDTVSLRGTILRLRVSSLPAGPGAVTNLADITPANNPFVTHPDLEARLVFVTGLRNPFRFHLDRPSGDVFVADVGEDSYEEVSIAANGGENMGWPRFEGNASYASCAGGISSGFTAPITTVAHTSGSYAIIGGGVYRLVIGSATFPGTYEGNYFYSDYYHGFLRRLSKSGANWSLATAVPGQPNATDWGTGFVAVSDYLVGPDGALWYCKQSVSWAANTGQIRRVLHTSATDVGEALSPGVSFSPPYPSPASRGATFAFSLPRAARVELCLYAVDGRSVRVLLAPSVMVAGPHAERWDGLDAQGAQVAPGLYFARLNVDDQAHTRSLAVVR